MANVLIVDDEPDIVLFVQVNLEMSGHQVRTAADGVAALAAVQDERPDVVILDVMMPHLDGWGVLDRLKADPDVAVRTIPVLMLTALGTDQDQARGGIEGAVRYLTKPISPDDLMAAVDDVLGGPPEPEQRKAAQQRGLTSLARMERNAAGGAAPAAGTQPRLSRLEHPRAASTPASTSRDVPPVIDGELTAKQRELLEALLTASSVSAAALELGMSRSNIYASLRRIGRKLGVADVSDLLHLLRNGDLAAVLER